MRLLMAFMATRALHSRLWVRRLVNSCGAGFANGGYPGLGRCFVSEVYDGTGQEYPDPLTRCLLDNAYKLWVVRDMLNLHIIHRIQSCPRNPCHNNDFQASKKINYLQDMQR
jgi:hypothetical protein